MAIPRFRRQLLLVALSLVHTVLAVTLTNTDFTIAIGVPFTITWTDAQGPVAIDLIGGPDPNQPLSIIGTIASNLNDGAFTWIPAPVPVQNVYGLRVYDNISPEAYSFAFQIQGNTASSSTPVPSTTTRPASSSASSAATGTTSSPPRSTGSKTSASSDSTASPSVKPTSSAAPIPLAPGSDTPPLSTGAKVGIGIGATIAFIALLTWAIFRMRRAQREDAAAEAGRGLELGSNGKQPEKPGGPPGGGPGMMPGMGMGGPPSHDGRGTPLMGGRDTPVSSMGGRETPVAYGQAQYNMAGAGIAIGTPPPGGSPPRGKLGHQPSHSVASTIAASRHYSMQSVVTVGQFPVRQTPEPWRTPR